MNIHKIFKSYFAFICIISAVAMMTSNDAFNDSFVSIFHSTNTEKPLVSRSLNIQTSYYKEKNIGSSTPVNLFVLPNENNFAEMTKIEGGDNILEVMNMTLSTQNTKELKTLKLTLNNISNSNIETAILFVNDVPTHGTLSGISSILFNNIDATLNTGKSKLSVKIQLKDNVSVGTRFRVSINSQMDIKFKDKESAPNTFYPIFGKYITTVNNKN